METRGLMDDYLYESMSSWPGKCICMDQDPEGSVGINVSMVVFDWLFRGALTFRKARFVFDWRLQKKL